MPEPIRDQIAVEDERAVLAGVLLPNYNIDPRDPLGELRSLASTAGARTVAELMQKRQKPYGATYMGKGKVKELAQLVKETQADVVIFENDLSPAQLRNIEEVVEVKVLDRSELILDIFATRAQTFEARLQVELAQLEYTYPRLRAMWSHLERIAGGAPAGIGTRGPGEQQLEIDRRLVQRRKGELKREIDKIHGRMQRHLEQRGTDFYTVGIVGYTNAGKSTLFNTVTGAGVYADDKLFATLDTRTRKWDLGDGDSVMLSDTVGFVRNLPHHLVASFKATLEESLYSDVLVIVLDVSDPEIEKHFNTVDKVLNDLGAGEKPRIYVLNKIDQLADNAQILLWQGQLENAIPVSAVKGLGFDELVEAVRVYQSGGVSRRTIRLPMSDGKAIHFVEHRSKVLDRQYDATHLQVEVEIGERQLAQLRSMGRSIEVVE